MSRGVQIIGFLLLAWLPVILPVYAASISQQQVEAVEHEALARQMEVKKLQAKSAQLSLELAKMNQKMIQAARQLQADEDKTTRNEAELKLLENKLKIAEEDFNRENAQLAQNLASLQSLALNPTESLLVQPLTPVEIIRSAILLRESVPFLHDKAEKIKTDMESITRQKKEVEVKLKKLAEQKQSLLKQQQNIKKMAAQKTAVRRQIEGESRKTKKEAEKLASQATDLRELMEKLEHEQDIKRRRQEELRRAAREREIAARERYAREQAVREQASSAQRQLEEAQRERLASGEYSGMRTEDGRQYESDQINEDMDLININPKRIKDTAVNFAGARGSLTRPARGPVITAYGQELSKGVTSKGIVIKTRNAAQVIAPYDGSVIFSGPFKGYGNLIIIDHGKGYMSLLAGMDSVDTESGQMVLAGEPVGIMPDADSAKLYVEIRKDKRPVNPASWLGG